MPLHIAGPTRVTAAGNKPKLIDEYVGRVEETTPDPARAAQLLILRNAVATGRYRPDLHAVARQLLLAIAAEPRD